MYRRIFVFSASALLSAPALFAQAPLSLSSEVGVHSAYEGRGLTFTQGPVLQGSLDVGSSIRGFDVFLGAWANFEVYESPTRRRMLPAGVHGPSEINLYGGVSRAVGPLHVEAGAIQFLFPAGFDFSSPGPITEVYGSLGAALPGAPKVTAYYDCSARGWYSALHARQAVPVGFGEIWVGGELGASLGQADAGEYYGRDGLTHGGVSAGMSWKAGAVSVEPSVRVTRAIDEATLHPAPLGGRGARNKLVFGLSLGWER